MIFERLYGVRTPLQQRPSVDLEGRVSGWSKREGAGIQADLLLPKALSDDNFDFGECKFPIL
jgi:hypothetical protein